MTLAELKKYAKKLPKLKPYVLKEDFEKKYNEMTVHTQRRKPEDLLIKRRPNEPEEVKNYRVENYESVTYGSMNKSYTNVSRIFTPQNFHLTIEDDKIAEYLKTKNFMRNSFLNYYFDVRFKRMIDDANGFVLWLPGGEGLTDSSKNVLAYPKLVYSFDLLDWEEDYIVFLSPDKSYIETEAEVTKDGNIYLILTKDSFYTYTQQKYNEYILKEVYKHGLGVLPIEQLGGDMTGEGIFESFFATYLAFGNECVRQFSDWQSLSMTSAHPIREVFQMDCEVQELKDEDDEDSRKDNPEGKNLKYKHKRQRIKLIPSAYGEISRPVGETDPDGLGPTYLKPEIESIRFLRPGVEYVESAQKSYKLLLEDAEDSLHLNLGDKQQSGVAKEMDLRLNEDFLNKIGRHTKESMETSLKFIIAYYNAQPYNEVATGFKISTPMSFRTKTEAELMEEQNKLKTGNAAAMLVSAVTIQLADIRFSGDELNQKIFDIISTYDPLFIYSVSEKQGMTIGNTAKRDDVTMSNYMYSILLNLSKEMGVAQFLDKKSEDLYKDFLERVKPFLVPETPLVDNSGNAI